jgi:hypothetical protein
MKPHFLLLVLALLTSCTSAQNAPCSEAKVIYSAPPAELVKKISIEAATASDLPSRLKKQPTLQETRWLAISAPEYTKPGPWSSTLFIGDRQSPKTFLRITISDHGNILSADWISEKLLHITVWWGRIAASDIIVDVEKSSIVYHELGNYGQLVNCREPS